MHPDKVRRGQLRQFTDLPNVGPRFADDLRLLGFNDPAQLAGQDAFVLYRRLCQLSGMRQDPCVLDTLLAIVDFCDGNRPRAWWHYTAQRKQQWPSL